MHLRFILLQSKYRVHTKYFKANSDLSSQVQILRTYMVINEFWFGVKDLHSSVVWNLFFQNPVLPSFHVLIAENSTVNI